MRRNGIVAGMLCVAFIGGFADAARAQSVASSFAELKEKSAKPPRTVYVTDVSGRKVKGQLADLSPTSLTLLNGDDRESFDEARVLQVSELRHDTGKGALAGMAIGALGGALMIATSCNNCGEYASGFASAGAVLFGGIGAGIGAAVGAHRTHEQVLYRAPAPAAASRLTVMPFVSGHSTGAALSLRF